MTSYDQLRNALNTIRPACEQLDRDLLIHALSLTIDGYGSKRNMSCKQKSEIAMEVFKTLEMQRLNI